MSNDAEIHSKVCKSCEITIKVKKKKGGGGGGGDRGMPVQLEVCESVRKAV